MPSAPAVRPCQCSCAHLHMQPPARRVHTSRRRTRTTSPDDVAAQLAHRREHVVEPALADLGPQPVFACSDERQGPPQPTGGPLPLQQVAIICAKASYSAWVTERADSRFTAAQSVA